MQESEIGLFINWLPADLLHITDDIRAITNSWDNLNALITQKVYTLLTRMVWSWMWRNVRYLLHPCRYASSLNEFRTEENKIPVKGAIKVFGTWVARSSVAVRRSEYMYSKSQKSILCFWEHWPFFSQSSNIKGLVWNMCSLYSYTAVSTGLLTTNW